MYVKETISKMAGLHITFPLGMVSHSSAEESTLLLCGHRKTSQRRQEFCCFFLHGDTLPCFFCNLGLQSLFLMPHTSIWPFLRLATWTCFIIKKLGPDSLLFRVELGLQYSIWNLTALLYKSNLQKKNILDSVDGIRIALHIIPRYGFASCHP